MFKETSRKRNKMPMLLDKKNRLKKELINLVVKGIIKYEINGCHAGRTNITINKDVCIPLGEIIQKVLMDIFHNHFSLSHFLSPKLLNYSKKSILKLLICRA